MANSIQIKKLKLGIRETEKTALLALLCKWTNLNKIFLSKSFDRKESEREKEKEMRATDVSADKQTNKQTNREWFWNYQERKYRLSVRFGCNRSTGSG